MRLAEMACVVSVLWCTITSACSDDERRGASVDAGLDATVALDAGGDSSVSSDGSMADAPASPDGATDGAASRDAGGCGDPVDAGPATDAGPAPATVDDFVRELSVLVCEAMEDCSWPIGYAAIPLVPIAGVEARLTDTESEACVGEVECEYARDAMPSVRAAIADGSLTYRPDGAARCLTALRGRCFWLLDGRAPYLHAECSDVFTGNVPVGGSCRPAGCLDGPCVIESCVAGAGCRLGTCVAFDGVGDSCSGHLDCAPGLECEGSFESQVCRTYRGPDAACATHDECGAGLLCTSGRCSEIPRFALGEPCAPDEILPCEGDLSCAYEAARDALVCQRRACSGAACSLGFPDPCPDGEACLTPSGSMIGTCAPLPGEGEPCASAYPSCSGPLVCTSGTCAPLSCPELTP
jgi:hypothetical protein